MGIRLRDMIRAVRACKTAAEERGVIARESANLRTAFKEDDQDYRHRNVAKLMFIHMLGYPTHFGQMECLKLIASPGFPEKRIGYLGLMLLLDERQEVIMLVTNSLKNDLNHTNQFIAGLALCALGNICTAEMARDLAPEVEKLLHNSNSYIRKKAALSSVRIVRKVPDLVENLLSSASSLLSDKHHGVLIAGIKLCTELCEASPVALEHFRKQTSSLVRILKNLVISGYAPEYDVGGITDPFLQIRTLRLLRMVGKGDPDSSDIMSDILAQVATNTESNKNAGNAILYECVLTIMAIEAIGGLRVLAINILGRFLGNRDNNIRYVALNTLIKVVAVDTQAVQRHRTTIVECVKDSDISIRRRALELVCALVNETNVKTLTKELLEYLKVSDLEFKGDMTTKICYLVQKYFPTKRWYIDQIVKVMAEAGRHVKDDVTRALLLLISNAAELHGYSVRLLYTAFQKWDGQESLAQVTAWCIGEYGEMLVNHVNELDGEDPITVSESDAVDVLELVLKDFRPSSVTRAMALTALLKVSSRFPLCTERVKALVLQYKGSLELELQQRSIEFGSILNKHDNIKVSLVEKMPVLDETAFYTKKIDAADATLSMDSKSASTTAAVVANGSIKSGTDALMDLLNLNVDEASTPLPPQTRKSAGDVLLDLLGGNSSFDSPLTVSSAQASTGGANALLDLLSVGNSTSQTSSSLLPTLEASSQRIPEAAPQILPDSVPDLLSLNTLSSKRDSDISFTADSSKKSSMSEVGFDLLGDLAVGPLSSVSLNGPVYPPIVAYQNSSGLTVSFDFSKQPANLSATVIKATYTNNSPNTCTDVIFQAAVPKFIQLQLEPASGNVLPANGSGTVTQVIRLNNSQHGQKSLAMRIRISYKVNGQPMLEQGQVNNFPPGL